MARGGNPTVAAEHHSNQLRGQLPWPVLPPANVNGGI
jgi:hypothetical protein